MSRFLAFIFSTVVLFLAVDPAAAKHKEVIELSDARVIIEINDTDGDSGIQIFLDAEGWKWMAVYDPYFRRVMTFRASGSARQTGVTELFLESAEPGFDDLPLDEFLHRFPEGTYLFWGRTVDGDILIGEAELTHALPDGPVLVSPEEDETTTADNTIVEWLPVSDPEGSSIVNYQVLVVQEEPTLRVLDMMLPADATSVKIPFAFLAPGGTYKYEILAIEESGNQTLSEREFEVEG